MPLLQDSHHLFLHTLSFQSMYACLKLFKTVWVFWHWQGSNDGISMQPSDQARPLLAVLFKHLTAFFQILGQLLSDSGCVKVHMSCRVRRDWISSCYPVGATSFMCMINQMWRRLMLGIRQTQDVGPRGCRTKIPARRLGKCSEKWDYKEIHIQVKETWWKWGDCGNKQAATCSIECCLDPPSDLKLASFGATPLPTLRKQKVTPIELQVSSLSSVIEVCPRMSWNSRSPTTDKASTTQPGLQLLFRKLALLLQ